MIKVHHTKQTFVTKTADTKQYGNKWNGLLMQMSKPR